MSDNFKINLFIGTPAYNSMVHTDYLHSLLSYKEAGIPFTVMTLGNESLITRGRNTVISYFYSMSMLTHLVFLDADIYLPAEGLIQLLSHRKDVIGARVPLKGHDKKGKPVFNVGEILEEEGKLLKVDKVGTAVMILSKKAINELVEHAKANGDAYKSNPYTRGDAANITHYDIFKTGVFEGEYDSEDFYVCRVLKELGFDIYVDPNVNVRHNGMFVFGE